MNIYVVKLFAVKLSAITTAVSPGNDYDDDVKYSDSATPGRARSNDLAGRSTALANDLAEIISGVGGLCFQGDD